MSYIWAFRCLPFFLPPPHKMWERDPNQQKKNLPFFLTRQIQENTRVSIVVTSDFPLMAWVCLDLHDELYDTPPTTDHRQKLSTKKKKRLKIFFFYLWSCAQTPLFFPFLDLLLFVLFIHLLFFFNRLLRSSSTLGNILVATLDLPLELCCLLKSSSTVGKKRKLFFLLP